MSSRSVVRQRIEPILLRIRQWMIALRSHPLRTALGCALAIFVGVIAIFGRYLAKHLLIWLRRFIYTIYHAMQAHPSIAKWMHILINAVPDIAYALLALAGLAYLMPDLISKLEARKAVRVFLFSLFALFGVSAILVNAVNRTDQEEQATTQNLSQTKVLSSVLDIQQSLHSDKAMTEAQRRERISESLRDEYILTHNPIPPEILAGNEMPPQDWMNSKLHDLGESWSIENTLRPRIAAAPRSYLRFVGYPLFTGTLGAAFGDMAEGRNFKPGDILGFNVHFTATGPNPVKLIETASLTFLEPDYSADSIKTAINTFLQEATKERAAAVLLNPQGKGEPQTLMQGDQQFFTPSVSTGTAAPPYKPWPLTQDDLDKFKSGTEVSVVMAVLTYKDGNRVHHLRQCLWLQPPAQPPGIWHFCGGFPDSD
jgi:hypothetical protein